MLSCLSLTRFFSLLVLSFSIPFLHRWKRRSATTTTDMPESATVRYKSLVKFLGRHMFIESLYQKLCKCCGHFLLVFFVKLFGCKLSNGKLAYFGHFVLLRCCMQADAIRQLYLNRSPIRRMIKCSGITMSGVYRERERRWKSSKKWPHTVWCFRRLLFCGSMMHSVFKWPIQRKINTIVFVFISNECPILILFGAAFLKSINKS